MDPLRFWGVRAIGTATPTYTIVYNYTGNPAVTSEVGLKLVKRSNVSVAAWADALATLDIYTNTLTVTGETGTEYALAISTASPPLAPSGLNVTASSPFQVNISWIDNSGDKSNFEIERSVTGNGGTYLPLATLGAGITSYNDNGLTPYSEYCYRVRATNGAGASTYAGPLCATTPQEGDYGLQLTHRIQYVTSEQPAHHWQLRISRLKHGSGEQAPGLQILPEREAFSISYPSYQRVRLRPKGAMLMKTNILGINSSGNVIAADFEEGTGSASPGLNHPIRHNSHRERSSGIMQLPLSQTVSSNLPERYP